MGIKRLIAKRWPNFAYNILDHIKSHKRFPNIFHPILFNDKVLHRKLFDRRPILTQFADKYAVRKYVEERIGPERLPKLYHVTTDPSDIPFEELPDKFVIKPTHGSGWVRVVTDKSTINKSEIIEQCNYWLSLSFYKKTGEWVYKNIPPRIIIEEYIEDGSGLSPNDYKFFTYNGVPHFIQVDMSRFGDHKRDFYDTQWNRLPIKLSYENSPSSLPCPPHLREMLTFAQMLGEGIDFVRIDFYDTSEKAYLGEITTTPGNGSEHFQPPIYDRIFGEPWNIRNRNIPIENDGIQD